MNIKKIVIALIALGIAGLLFFAFKEHYIILNFSRSVPAQTQSISSNKKKVALAYWKDDQWHQETISLLASPLIYNNLYHMVSQYLKLLHDESIIKQRVIVQQVLVHYDNQEALISLDRVPWHKESCSIEKLMIIEGILKTITINEPSIKKIRFLVNHQPMTDTHLDFSNAWPIEGFLST